jgi:hypothetical protein
MGTSQGNRLVSAAATNRALPLGLRRPGYRPAKPCARDPPELCRLRQQRHYRDGLRRARHARGPQGKTSPRARPQTERGDAVNIASSQRRTRKS